MDQNLIIAILVGVIVFLLGLLLLLVAASSVLVWNNKRYEEQRRAARRERDPFARALEQPEPALPSPTPISRIAAPIPEWNIETTASEEAATEVIGPHHAAAFFEDEVTGTTEVRSLPLEGLLQLDETDETTKNGVPRRRSRREKK